MIDRFVAWCGSDTTTARLTRTIVQGVIGVLIANVDFIIGTQFDAQTKAVIVALTMAVLTPIQAEIGKVGKES